MPIFLLANEALPSNRPSKSVKCLEGRQDKGTSITIKENMNPPLKFHSVPLHFLWTTARLKEGLNPFRQISYKARVILSEGEKILAVYVAF